MGGAVSHPLGDAAEMSVASICGAERGAPLAADQDAWGSAGDELVTAG
jgi:hypothetical protein